MHGQFCFACGQNQKSVDRHFLSLVSEFLEEVITPRSRVAKTLFAISFKPGYLTKEYFSGRKARYIQPVRLYLTTSILFFFVISVSNVAQINLTDENQQPIVIANDDTIVVDENWSFLSDEESDRLNEQLNAQFQKAATLLQEDPNRALDMVLDKAPPIIFFLVPLFAALLKIVYFNKRRYYTEHLVLALHNHSFVFLALLIDALLNQLPGSEWKSWSEFFIEAWIVIYLYQSLRINYGDGWVSSGFKFAILGISYWILFSMTAVVALLIGVMTL